MTSKEDKIKNLQLFGEHINLTSRTRFGEDVKKFRPQSALYTTTKYTPENSRRPFSAGTEPTSPKLLSFLRHTHTDRPDMYLFKNSEYYKDSSIPGTVESSMLCEKFIKEPIHRNTFTKQKFYYDLPEQQSIISDNCSENSSLDTCISLGTKIKVKAQNLNSEADYEIEGRSINLKKMRPFVGLTMEKYFDNDTFKKSLNVIPEKDYHLPNTKIHLPISKDENTSSGVSSSSDMHTFHTTQSKKSISDIQTGNISYKENSLPLNKLKLKKPLNISINWFPPTLSKTSDMIEYNSDDNKSFLDDSTNNKKDEKYNSDNLAGRVSFAKSQYNENSIDNGENSYDISPTYDTQLSLVEEESSQDSDKSPNLSSWNCISSRKNDKPNDTNLFITQYNKYKTFSSSILPKTNLTTKDDFEIARQKNENGGILKNDDERRTFVEDEYEMKFKALEDKYKNEMKNDKPSNYSKNISSLITSTFVDKTQESESRMSINDFSPTKLVENTFRESYEAYDSNYNHPLPTFDHVSREISERATLNKNLLTDFNTTKLQFNSPGKNIDRNSINCENEDEISKREINEFYLQSEEHSKTFEMPKHFESSSSQKEIISDNASLNSREDKNISDMDSKMTVDDSNYENNKRNEDEVKVLEYPQYLKESETKSYTSKVIEEYRQEIASINNFHDLTLQDLRKKCNEFKSNMSFDTSNTKNLSHISSGTSGDEIEEIVITEKNDDKPKYFESHMGSYKKKKFDNVISKHDSNFSELENYNTSKNIHKDSSRTNSSDFHNGKEKYKSSKTRKRIKKKDVCSDSLTKYENEDLRAKKPFPKKNNFERKKHQDNSNFQKPNKNVWKFKAQKIMLTKSSTKINRTVFYDDRDVISWMGTRINTPLEDLSSCENTERNKMFIDSKVNEKEKPARNSVHFEDEIILNEELKNDKLALSNNYDALNNTFSQNLSNTENDLLTQNNSDVDIMAISPPTDFSKSSETTNTNSNFEICNALENDSMIDDIYSTIHDIENHYGSQDKIVPSTYKQTEETNENVTVEYKDIASYLEKVENSVNEDMSSLSHNQPLFALKVEELMDLSKAELAHRAVVGVLAAGRASAIASGLKGALAQAAKVSAARLKAIKAAAKQDATIAASQTAQALTKHQKFIEQLVNEKKTLTERIEELTGAIASAEARRGRAARTSAERLQLELRNQRQRLNAVHQRDRQAWLKHHTQKIKDMTVKELEVEIQEMEKKHMIQLGKVQRDADMALLEARDEHAKEIRKIKDNAARQLEDELDKERLLATERLEQKRVEWETAMLKATERAGLEARDAAQRAEEAVRSSRHEADLWKMEQEEELERQRKSLEKDIDEKKAQIKMELKQLKENLMKEFEKFKAEYSEKQNVILKEMEAEMRLVLRRERDREIEKAIDCMEKDAEEGRRDMQEMIRKIKEKYERDKTDLEESEKTAVQRCTELREQFGELQEKCSKYQITITQLEGKLKHAEEMTIQNKAQSDMLIKTAEIKGQESLQEIQAQLQNLQQKHKDEMHRLFAKVKVVIARKDDALTLAKRETVTLRERCIRLEARHVTN